MALLPGAKALGLAVTGGAGLGVGVGFYLHRAAAAAGAKLEAARLVTADTSLRGRHAVVVGGTSGIGEGIAVRLAESGADVTVVGRSSLRGNAVVKRMARANAEGAFAFRPLDAMSLPAVASFADNVPKLDLLVMTQGMATLQGYTPTPDGLDEKMTLHYFSRALLAQKLAPKLACSMDGRVLSVLSAGVHAEYTGDFDLAKNYTLKNAADAAGHYNDLGLASLSVKTPGVTFVHASPGFVATRWGVEMPAALRYCIRLLQDAGGRTKEDCAEFMVSTLLDPKIKQGGFHLRNEFGEPILSKRKQEEAAAKQQAVWQQTQAILKKYC